MIYIYTKTKLIHREARLLYPFQVHSTVFRNQAHIINTVTLTICIPKPRKTNYPKIPTRVPIKCNHVENSADLAPEQGRLMFLVKTRMQYMNKASPDKIITINEDIQLTPASPRPEIICKNINHETMSTC